MPRFSFSKPTLQAATGHAGGALRFWNLFKTLSVQAISDEAGQPFHLALIGTEDQTALLRTRLARESPVPRDLGPEGPPDVRAFVGGYGTPGDAPPGSLTLDADALTADEGALAAMLARLVGERPDLRVALARHVPAFRPAAAQALIADACKENARIALLSALPGVLPMTAFLLPATALGDMVILTRNQGMLLLRIAAAYGKEIDLKARTRELLPVVGGAFGWRAAARELIGLVPGGVGLAIKGAVAYAGTYTVGKAAAVYYSTGQALPAPRLRQLYRDALADAGARIAPLLRRAKGKNAGEDKDAVDNGDSARV